MQSLDSEGLGDLQGMPAELGARRRCFRVDLGQVLMGRGGSARRCWRASRLFSHGARSPLDEGAGPEELHEFVFVYEETTAFDEQHQSLEDFGWKAQIAAVSGQAVLCRVKLEWTKGVGKPPRWFLRKQEGHPIFGSLGTEVLYSQPLQFVRILAKKNQVFVKTSGRRLADGALTRCLRFEVSAMASVSLSGRFLILQLFGLVSLATTDAQQLIQTKFRTAEQSMIVVPVMINGAGPFDFQLDTGCTSSIVDQRLADELHLTATGRAILQAAQGEAVTTVAQTDSVKMGDASVTGLDVLVVERLVNLRLKVRGVLGEDFLRHFDVYIDNRHHVIQLETGPGQLREKLTGDRLPLSSYGSGGEKLDVDRLVIVGQFDELRGKEAKLQLDSGTPYLLLCSQLNKPDAWNRPVTFPVSGVLGKGFAAYAQTAHLRLGKRFWSGVTAVVPTETIKQVNVDGLLPTSMFHSIFISHTGGFVILEPSTNRELTRSKAQSRVNAEIADMREE